jgi:hypothetical protein
MVRGSFSKVRADSPGEKVKGRSSQDNRLPAILRKTMQTSANFHDLLAPDALSSIDEKAVTLH